MKASLLKTAAILATIVGVTGVLVMTVRGPEPLSLDTHGTDAPSAASTTRLPRSQ